MHDNAPFHAARNISALLAIVTEGEKLMLWPPILPWPQPFWASLSKITIRVGDIYKVIRTTPTALIVQVKTVAEKHPRSDNHKECNAAPRKMPPPCGLYREHCKLVQSGYKLIRSIKQCPARTREEKVESKVSDLPTQCNRFWRWAWVTTDGFLCCFFLGKLGYMMCSAPFTTYYISQKMPVKLWTLTWLFFELLQ